MLGDFLFPSAFDLYFNDFDKQIRFSLKNQQQDSWAQLFYVTCFFWGCFFAQS